MQGAAIEAGSVVGIRYIVYRLSSGAYFKYSSGGKPVFLWSLGYGNEGQDDVGDLYTFTLGVAGDLPRAVPSALVGMRKGGRRRVLVPPQLGWTDDSIRPRPITFGAKRRLVQHRDEPLLFEAEVVAVYPPGSDEANDALQRAFDVSRREAAFRLPLPKPLTAPKSVAE